MDNNGELITIKEAAGLTGISISSIYKQVQKERISIQSVSIKGKRVKQVKISDLEKLYGPIGESQIISENGKVQEEKISENLRDSLKEVIETYFQDRETQLMKPMEELALYKVGRLEERIENLEREKELILEENQTLRESMKALPGPIPEIKEKLEQQETAIATLEKEKQTIQEEATQALHIVKVKEQAIEEVTAKKIELEAKLQSEEKQKIELKQLQEKIAREKQEAIQRAQEKEQVLQRKQKDIEALEKEKEAAMNKLEEEKELTIQRLQAQKEREMAEMQKQKELEAQELQKKIEAKEQEEKNLFATVEALKERLEAEEKKSWWQKLFGN